jgi:hypothetical protein
LCTQLVTTPSEKTLTLKKRSGNVLGKRFGGRRIRGERLKQKAFKKGFGGSRRSREPQKPCLHVCRTFCKRSRGTPRLPKRFPQHVFSTFYFFARNRDSLGICPLQPYPQPPPVPLPPLPRAIRQLPYRRGRGERGRGKGGLGVVGVGAGAQVF